MATQRGSMFEIDLFNGVENFKVNTVEYQKAVEHLLTLERINCGASHRAASVLLSLYNGSLFKVDLADVCGALDSKYLKSVLVAIAGRHQLLMEPHAVVPNGARVFEQLAEAYLPFGRSL